ncbi:MAG: DUF998 domain-containing protein [archaeon GB-1867-005]|nr:DUF998 domain-containing protein [Candidatus Culexmicrobium cathedralense]
MKLKYFAICGFIAPAIAYSSIALAIMQMPHFSWFKNALSDLGVWKSSAYIFNFGLILAGAIQIIFTFSLSNYFNGLIGVIGSTFYFASSTSLALIGVFPESAGRIHFYVSLSFFTLTPISLIFFAISLIKECREIKLGAATLILAVLAIFPWLIPWKTYGIHGVAIPELLSSISASIWNIHTALKLYRRM